MPAFVVYLNAMPGVGKLTIAKALQYLLPGCRLIHNHELIDPVEKVCPRGTSRYQAMSAAYRQQRLQPINKEPKLHDITFIFTDSQTEYNECVSDYTDLCLSTSNGGDGRRLYSVVLECDAGENERRLVQPERGKGAGNGKLTDVSVLREYRSRREVWRFEDADETVLDVTAMKPEEAARRIVEFVGRREMEGRSEIDFEEPDYSV